jgi:uncharacterized protein HemY
MKTKVIVVGFLAVASLAWGQKVKSKNEQAALMEVINATTPDAKIAAVDNMIGKYKDTEFKAAVLEMAAEAAQQKGDSASAIVYGNRALEADAKNFQAMLLVAGQIAQSTREFDLDKDEKVKRASKLSNDAIAAVTAAAKPNPQLSDDQWAGIKKDLIAQSHETLGMLASVDKKWDAAIAEYKTAIEGATNPDAATMLRLAAAYTNSKQFDQGIAMAEKVLALPGAPANLKKIADEEKQRASKLKAGQK